MKKSSICFALCLMWFSYPVHAKNSTIVSAGKVAASLGIALCAHILTELPILYAHEYGHACGSVLSGGEWGSVHVKRPSSTDPFAFCMPFVGYHTGGNGTSMHHAAGPCAGIASNYACMVGANTLYAKKKHNLSGIAALKRGMASPFNAYKNLANEFTRMIVERDRYTMQSVSHIAMMAFNILKSSKMVGEVLYGLTPVSVPGGDGHELWKNFGLKKDLTVTPLTQCVLGVLPAGIAIMYGVQKGVYLNKQN